MSRMILVSVLISLSILAIAGGVGYWIYNNYNYYSTDDAQVTGPIVNISAPAAGILSTLSVKLGDTVTSGETLGSVTPAASGAARTGKRAVR